MLISDLGAPAYEGLWTGTTAWDGVAVTHALRDFAKLLTYANPDRDSLDWAAATQRVIDGEAAFTVMGDWALVAFDEANKKAGTDFTTFPVPGTDGVFDLLADTFTLPTGAPHPAGTRAWLETVASTAGQTTFSRAKGSIPARTDVTQAPFEPYQRDAMTAFVTDILVPSLAHGTAAPTGVLAAMSAATQSFTTGSTSIAQFQSALTIAAAGS